MKNKELQDLLKQFPDEIEIQFYEYIEDGWKEQAYIYEIQKRKKLNILIKKGKFNRTK